ncbi:MAG: hypothetical protein ACUVWX_08880, partial [Kiritimatiellia bacterium]
LRPLFSSSADPVRGETRREFLWPLGVVRERNNQRYWLFLTAFGHDFDVTARDSRYRTVVLPLLFIGRAGEGDKYFALFPFGGTIREFLGRDEIEFVLFPLYSKSRVKGVETQSVLWPIFSYTRGNGVLRYRIFPFYGRSINEGRWEKTFILWPIWNSTRYSYPHSSGQAYVLFPVFGRVSLTDQHGWMLLPPLFKWIEGERQSVINCPWPFFEYARGEVDRLRFWPFWGSETRPGSAAPSQKDNPNALHSAFFLWPLGHYERIPRGGVLTTRFLFFPLVYHEKVARDLQDITRKSRESYASDHPVSTSGETNDTNCLPAVRAESDSAALKAAGSRPDIVARQFKIWPLYSYRRRGDSSLARFPELWPVHDLDPLERNIAPLWTLYSRIREGSNVENEFLWGLVRHRRTGRTERHVSIFPLFRWERTKQERKWSVLGGLAGASHKGDSHQYRILYFIHIELNRANGP